MNEEILRIENVSKKYRLGMIGGTTLRDELQRKKAKRKGLEDPTRKVTDTSTGNIGEEFLALDDINISINQGERVGIIGHNGAGKSTLLKLISRITAPTTGTIEMNGRIASMLEVGTGFHPELTGRENIYMNGAILGMNKAEIDSKIEEIIDFSECRQFIDTPVKRYSSGMYVKLAFSVAAHLDSEIMIMDEVLAVGDMAFQNKCLRKMNQVSKDEGRTILYVSHNMNTIRQLCDRCIVLDHGRITFNGDVEEAIETYLGISNASGKVVNLRKKDSEKGTLEGVKFDSIECNTEADWRIKTGELLPFEIAITADKDLENVGFRVGVLSGDGSPISLVLSDSLFSCRCNEQLKFKYLLDTTMLVPGDYCLTLVLYGVDIYGNWIFYDHIINAVTFTVRESAGFNNNIKWNKKYWGYVKLPEMKKIK